jgi:hypothetical protein
LFPTWPSPTKPPAFERVIASAPLTNDADIARVTKVEVGTFDQRKASRQR